MTSFHLVLLNTEKVSCISVWKKVKLQNSITKNLKEKGDKKYFKTNCSSQNVLK